MSSRILDLYCGMGGLSLGFLLALDSIEIHGLDIDRYAVETYNLNLSKLGGNAKVQDVLEWIPDGDYDIVMGGSPCQPFTIANNRKPCEQHSYFPTFSRFFDVVLSLKPKVFILENVKGLVMSRNRIHLLKQLERIADDYYVKYNVLNAVNYGVPQKRERLFVIGTRRDLHIKPSFPKPTHGKNERITIDGDKLHRWVLLKEAIGDLLTIPPSSRVFLMPDQVERISRERKNASGIHWGEMDFPDSLDEPSRTVSSHTIEGTKRETIVLAWTSYQAKHPPLSPDEPSHAITSHLAKASRDGLVPIADHVMTEKGGWDNTRSDWGSRIMDLDDPAYTITEKHRSGQLVSVLSLYRRLTVRECMRIQSFPDWWTFPKSVSISRKYRLVGEAVPPILAYRLAVAIGKILGLKTKEPPKKEEWDLPYFYRAFADYL
jgi:DNA (cytosine-5)-methyltransferase 1